jgi:hypothetical protein
MPSGLNLNPPKGKIETPSFHLHICHYSSKALEFLEKGLDFQTGLMQYYN